MSLVITVYVPSGIVMTADSRVTVLRSEEAAQGAEGEQKPRVQQRLVLSDNAYKMVALDSIGVGLGVYDDGVINNEPVESHVYRFEEEEITPEDDVISASEKFIEYFQGNFPGVSVGFHMAGYRLEGRTRVPYVYVGHTTREAGVRRVNVNEKGKQQYGILRSGEIMVVNRLIDQSHLPLFAAMPLQDAVDYAVHLIRTTIETMRFEPRFPSVGGPVDVLVVTPTELRWVRRKELSSDLSSGR